MIGMGQGRFVSAQVSQAQLQQQRGVPARKRGSVEPTTSRPLTPLAFKGGPKSAGMSANWLYW